MSTAWTSRYALRTKGITSSAIRDLLKVAQRPGMISFAGGLPAPAVFPIQRFEEACHTVLTQQAASALQYGETEGYPVFGVRALCVLLSPPKATIASAIRTAKMEKLERMRMSQA